MNQYFDLGIKPKIVGNHRNEAEETLKVFHQVMRENKTTELRFNHVNTAGDLSVVIKGVTVIMKNREVTPGPSEYDTYRRSGKELRPYICKVVDIDATNLTVYVSHRMVAEDKRQGAYDRLKNAVIAYTEGSEEYKANNLIVLPAEVKHVDEYRQSILVNLAGLDILGYIYASDWDHVYTQDVKNVAKVGDILDVAVISHRNPKSKYQPAFACSRKLVVPDPWVGIESRYQKNDIVNVKCVEILENYWFGELTGDDKLRVLVEYPSRNDGKENFRIILEQNYECCIYAVNEQRRHLKARVFNHVKN